MSRSDRILVAAAGGAIVLAVAAMAVRIVPAGAGSPTISGDPAAGLLIGTPIPSAPAAAGVAGTIVVDVEGAVVSPGIRELPAGSRIADAIEAADGYAADADLAAAIIINLAQPLTDGQQVRVPRICEQAAAAAPSTAAGAASGGGQSGQVNLNTATPEELEALPGIGEVTVQKIVAARQERPFASLQEAVDRGIINRGQLEDIQGVATAG